MSLRKMLQEVNAGRASPDRHAAAENVNDTDGDALGAQFEPDDDDDDDDDELPLEGDAYDAYLDAMARACKRDDRRQSIYITDNESVLVDEAIAALAQRSVVYQHAGELAVINYDPEDKSYRMTALKVPGVRRELSRAAVFYKKGKKGKKGPRTINIPTPLPGMVHSAGTFPDVRPLRGISPVPILHADGSVFAEPGQYDPSTGLAYYPTREYRSLSETTPTLDEAKTAAQEILAVYNDFPFEAEADKAAVVALILTLIARHLVEGPTPAFMVKANVPGAGKGKVIETAVAIALGVDVAIMTPTDDEAEDRKQITACLRAGDRVIAFDNVLKFGGAVWDGLLTSTKWSGRNLGKTEQLKLPVNAVVTVTSNGCRLIGDAGRRTLPIRLHTDEPRPELRSDFKAELPHDAIANHPHLFMCALIILRYGLTLTSNPGHWGSYENWCRIVRRTVTAVLTDPCATRDGIKDSDETLNTLRSLLSTICVLGAGNEWTSSELIKASRPQRDDTGQIVGPGDEALAEALAGLVGDADRVIAQSVGVALKTHLERRVELADGSRAWLTRRMLDGRPRWRVETEVPP